MKVSFLGSRVEKFVEELPKPTISQVLQVIGQLEKFGNHLGPPHSKKVNKDIFELRTIGQISVRLLYFFHNGEAVILNAFVKKTDKIPKRELENAVKRMGLLRHI